MIFSTSVNSAYDAFFAFMSQEFVASRLLGGRGLKPYAQPAASLDASQIQKPASTRNLQSLYAAAGALLLQVLCILDGEMLVRSETEDDWNAVYALNAVAFETPAEANLVNSLRKQVAQVISLVAIEQQEIVGHIMFSPVSLTGCSEIDLMGLAPMAVAPEHRGKGIGSALVQEGLERCRQSEIAAVAVLGHAQYYPRFGFAPAARFAITSEYDVPEEVFMILELRPNSLNGKTGTLKYHPAFNNV